MIENGNQPTHDIPQLDDRAWGVVTHDTSISDLTYTEAEDIVKKLGEKFSHEATIVTSDAAKRMLK